MYLYYFGVVNRKKGTVVIKVLVNGASGRMGSEVVRSIEKEEGLILCGAVDPKCTGQDIGDVVGIG